MAAERARPGLPHRARGIWSRCEDFEHAGRTVLASRLGYRITAKFVRTFLGRVFDHPDRVFDEAFLRPGDPGPGGVRGRRPQHHRGPAAGRPAGLRGRLDRATPARRCAALLSIMAHGAFEGKDAHHPDIRRLFTLRRAPGSDWYRQRLAAKQRVDERLWRRHVAAAGRLAGRERRAGRLPSPPRCASGGISPRVSWAVTSPGIPGQPARHARPTRAWGNDHKSP